MARIPKLHALVLVLLLLPSGVSAAGDQAHVLAAAATAANPSIAAAQIRIKALGLRVQQAGAWKDPVAAFEYSNMPIDGPIPGRHAMSGLQLKIQQTFTYPGKIGLRQEVARGQVREEKQRLAELKVQLAAMVRRAYYRLALVRQLRKVTKGHIKLIDQFLDVVRIKYEVGKVGQHDLLRLQLLRNKLKDDLSNFDRDDRALVETINATLRRGARQVIATPDRLTVARPPADAQPLLAEAARRRPLLALYVEQARTRRAAAKRAAREGYPDITAWFGYRIRLEAGADPGTNFVTLGVSVPLPLSYDDRARSSQLEQEALALAAEQQRGAELDAIRAGLGRLLANWRRAHQEAGVYRGKLMPLAHRTLDATFAAYRVGRADFASLFQAEVQLLQFERTIRKAEATAMLSQIDVEALMGRALGLKESRP